MGLDITFHEKATLTIPHEPHQDSCYDEGHIKAFVLSGLDHGLEGLVAERCYLPGGKNQHISQGYGNYGRFRTTLSLAVNGVLPTVIWEDPDAWKDKPFYEQINFADNEGVLGPVASRALAADYVEQEAAFEAGLVEAVRVNEGEEGVKDLRALEYYRQRYQEYKAAFGIVSETGIVEYG